MLILYDFECPGCGNVFEDLVHRDKLTSPCPECSTDAVRQVSAPRIDPRLGLSGDFPTMADKWEKVRRHHHTKGSKGEDWN